MKVAMIPHLLSMAALQVVINTISDATNDNKVGILQLLVLSSVANPVAVKVHVFMNLKMGATFMFMYTK